jgi:SAM-dependent methyltransferase
MALQQGTNVNDRWGEAAPYERYVGRWSRLVAREFVAWLDIPPGCAWADVGCGTGALSEQVLREAAPRALHGIDKAAGFVAAAQARLADARVRVEMADATALPMAESSCDAVVSGLVLNFVPEHAAMAAEMARVARPGGCVAAYVWDYAGGMQMMRRFWDAASAAASGAGESLETIERFPICAPEPLRVLWEGAGLRNVEVRAIEIPTHFDNFDDYWQPFLGGQGAAPTWLAKQDMARRESIRALLERTLPRDPAGGIRLSARAWAVKGRKPGA